MLITPSLLQSYNGINQEEDETSQELINIHIGSAQQIINDYIGFDCDDILEEGSNYTDSQIAMFKNVELRIATLLQLEDGSNIGVSNNSDIGISRSFVNIVDYTPYLKPLSAFRKNTGL